MRYSQGLSKPAPSQKCPSCERIFAADIRGEWMPFCSERCKLADLYLWMSESIGIPTGSSEEEDDAEPEPPPVRKQWNFD